MQSKNGNGTESFGDLNYFDPHTGVVRLFDEISPYTVKTMSEFLSIFLSQSLGEIRPDSSVVMKQIWIEIMSKGGCAKSGLAIYDMLKSVPKFIDISTVGIGYVCSAASIIYCAGDVRRAAPHTELLIHRPKILQAEGTKDEIQSKGNYIQKVEEQMLDIYTECIGPDNVKILRERILEGEVIIDAEEAKQLGFVTDVDVNERRPESEEEVEPVKSSPKARKTSKPKRTSSKTTKQKSPSKPKVES